MSRNRLTTVLLGLAAAAAALWLYVQHRRVPAPRPEPVPIQDGRTIDFSGGSPVVKDSAADKAAMDRTLREMDAAARTVTFTADPPPKK